MKVALISLNQKWEDKSYNLQRCSKYAACAAYYDVDLVIYPEMSLTGFTMNTKLSAEDSNNSSSIAAFKSIAKKFQMSVIAGVVVNHGDKAANTLVAISDEGVEQTRYVKIHPFTFANEDLYFQAGNKLATMIMSEFTLGFSICYDLRFPELYSALANTCDVLINIANWLKRRLLHWKKLLQARAIENQTFVIGVNRTGVDGNDLEYERSSVIVNANGDFISPIVTKDDMDIFEISRQELLDFRREFSTRQDRLSNLYRKII